MSPQDSGAVEVFRERLNDSVVGDLERTPTASQPPLPLSKTQGPLYGPGLSSDFSPSLYTLRRLTSVPVTHPSGPVGDRRLDVDPWSQWRRDVGL